MVTVIVVVIIRAVKDRGQSRAGDGATGAAFPGVRGPHLLPRCCRGGLQLLPVILFPRRKLRLQARDPLLGVLLCGGRRSHRGRHCAFLLLEGAGAVLHDALHVLHLLAQLPAGSLGRHPLPLLHQLPDRGRPGLALVAALQQGLQLALPCARRCCRAVALLLKPRYRRLLLLLFSPNTQTSSGAAWSSTRAADSDYEKDREGEGVGGWERGGIGVKRERDGREREGGGCYRIGTRILN